MGAALKFKTTQVPRQSGERARLKVVRGPDQGVVYIVTQGRAVIGRGEESDIVLSDLKASRQHAELLLAPDGAWKIKDLNSSNGILHNGKSAKLAALHAMDTLSIGESVLQFVTADQGTSILVANTPDLRQVQAEQVAFEEQRKRIQAMHSMGGQGGLGAILSSPPPASTQPQTPSNPRKIILYGLVGILAFSLFFEEKNKNKTQTKDKNSKAEQKIQDDRARVMSLKDYLPNSEPSTIQHSTDVLMKTGLREYWQGNWLRAKQQFETVLQIVPTHSLARRYLQNCEAHLQDEVKWHIQVGKEAFATGKYKSARGHFEAVLRLLYRDPENETYKAAKEKLQEVLKEMKIDPGEEGASS